MKIGRNMPGEHPAYVSVKAKPPSGSDRPAYPPPKRRTIPDFLAGIIRPADDAPLPAPPSTAPKCPACSTRLVIWRANRASCPNCAFVCVVAKP